MDRGKLIQTTISRYLMAVIALAVLFFWPAGTFDFWQAWLYMGLLFGLMLVVMLYLLKYSPELIERRMRTKEPLKEQSLIIKLSYIPFLLAYILPGFDRRYGWSDVPLWLNLLVMALVFLGYILVMWVFRENSYASRVVEVAQDQKVISSGPYALVRHPMYLGTLLLYVLSPLALGSYIALIPALLIIPVIIARILSEEKMLAKDLPGYQEYMEKVHFRLVPGVW